MHKPHFGDGNDDDKNPILLQVELNTIASSFSSLSTKAYQLHSFLSKVSEQVDYQGLDFKSRYENLSVNDSLDKIPGGLKAAFEAYGRER